MTKKLILMHRRFSAENLAANILPFPIHACEDVTILCKCYAMYTDRCPKIYYMFLRTIFTPWERMHYSKCSMLFCKYLVFYLVYNQHFLKGKDIQVENICVHICIITMFSAYTMLRALTN